MNYFLENDGLFVITGATGWVGSTALYQLSKILSPQQLASKVICFSSTERILNLRGCTELDDFKIPVLPLSNLVEIARTHKISYILHTAFLTREKLFEVGLDAYISTNRWITNQIEEALRFSPQTKLALISSGAAANLDYNLNLTELLSVNPYGVLKNEEERALSAYCPTLILRIYALTGKFIKNPKRFAIGDFLLNALRGESIKINSSNPVFRSYGNAGDITSVACRWLFSKKTPIVSKPIDAVNVEIDLLSMASQITNLYDLPPIQSMIDIEAPPDLYVADSEPFRQLLFAFNLRAMCFENQLIETAMGIKQEELFLSLENDD